jgi:transcriptional regulator with XRE-family HTH domain
MPSDAESKRTRKERVCKVFGSNLREARVRAGVSQERLAFAAQLHPTEISLLERGARDPRLATVVKLAHALGISPGALLDRLDS